MKPMRAWILAAVAVALIPPAAWASLGPTRVRLDEGNSGAQIQPLASGRAAWIQPTPVAYGPMPGAGSTPEIISHIGEILGAIDNSDDRNRLAEQWLQFSRQTIAKDQDLQQRWLQLQQQQLAQQQDEAQLRLQIAQLQLQIEQLRAQNLQLQQQLAQGPAVSQPSPPRQ